MARAIGASALFEAESTVRGSPQFEGQRRVRAKALPRQVRSAGERANSRRTSQNSSGAV